MRLYNAWLQQNPAADAVLIRCGLMNIATEFFVSSTASLFVNSTFGWPAIRGIDLPGGGPAYPLSAPGMKVTPQRRQNSRSWRLYSAAIRPDTRIRHAGLVAYAMLAHNPKRRGAVDSISRDTHACIIHSIPPGIAAGCAALAGRRLTGVGTNDG
jgi:Carbohydrate-selective porin, OprB family